MRDELDTKHDAPESCSDDCPWDHCRICGGYHCGWVCPEIDL